MENTNQKKSNVNFIIMVLLSVLLLFWIFKGCSGKTEPRIITVPEINGKFDQVKPDQKPAAEFIKEKAKAGKSEKVNPNDEFLQKQINLLLAENSRLLQSYESASDSLKAAMYAK